jgi:hypothetical protein
MVTTNLPTPDFTFDPSQLGACTAGVRPYRNGSYRLDAETISQKFIVHNYGHGGAGITLSFGCAAKVRDIVKDHLVSSPGTTEVAVLGTGVMGLTAATLLLDLGLKVTIYADRAPLQTTSAKAGGQWAVSVVEYAGKEGELAEILKTAHREFKNRIGQGYGVLERPNYTATPSENLDVVIKLVPGLIPARQSLSRLPFEHHTKRGFVYRTLLVEPPILLARLKADLDNHGVAFVSKSFASRSDVLTYVPQSIIVNCTGLGSMTLWSDPKGLVMVTAAGNNFAWVPSPKTIVFPARFNRVLAACGVMADGRAYAGLSPGEMQGNYGPVDKMDTALGAYTPNTPWAKIGCVKTVDMNGAGTSAATPQIAAAAALWLAAHWDEISAYPQAWMRVEAVRRALFDSAHKSTPRMDPTETQEKLGRGVMQAAEALKLTPRHASELKKSPPARASWPWLELIFGTGGVSVAANGRQEKMFALELTQMAQISPQVEATIVAPDADTTKISPAARNRYLEAALDEGAPSKPLREFLERHLRRDASKPGKARVRPSAAPAAARAVNRPQRRSTPQEPPNRRLRIFALDPGTAKRLETLPINETTLQTPWDDVETTGEPLRPGPVGEYLEVIDVDPVSRKVYDPVDLNDRFILARDGLTPSEGNPNFHQQMVYAVAMTTIRHFEEALGRKALWAPRYETDASGRLAGREVRRLRIYPHALRTANAYYSPDKKALLFGYFPAGGDDRGATAPGNMVFACLSSDIVAHEMSHALLDGLHRRFQEASNPDVPAFHEAFADIVAVFQHFTIPELVRFEVVRHRGAIEGADLLSGVAFQFGETSGVGAALRNYGKGAAKFWRYEDTLEPHDRAQILVLAIYRAFLAIVSRRTADLIRIGSGGSGILPKGAVHPDLVERLTMEICTAARHVLRMCIRALDYCPSVDITFGEYLRALITADADLVQSDDLGYRTAFIEGFRACGVPVRDVRTLSAESVTWNAPANDQPSWLKTIFEHVDFGLDRKLTRTEMFDLNEKNRWRVWSALKEAFNRDPALCGEFGLMPGIPRYDGNFGPLGPLRKNNVTTFNVFNVRPARRIAPDGSFRTDIVVVIDQRRPLFYDEKDPSQGQFWFRGGATLILDPNQGAPRVRYSIVKNIDSRSRIDIQRKTALGAHQSPMQALYFGAASFEPFAMMHSGQRDHEHG